MRRHGEAPSLGSEGCPSRRFARLFSSPIPRQTHHVVLCWCHLAAEHPRALPRVDADCSCCHCCWTPAALLAADAAAGPDVRAADEMGTASEMKWSASAVTGEGECQSSIHQRWQWTGSGPAVDLKTGTGHSQCCNRHKPGCQVFCQATGDSPSPLRPHYVKAKVRVHHDPDGTYAIFHGPRPIARDHADGTLLEGDTVKRAA